MKRTLSVLLAFTFSGILLVVVTTSKSKHSVPTVYASSGCSVATLNADYAFTDSGFAHPREAGIVPQAPEVPVAAVGVLMFDGAGNVSFPNLTLQINGSSVINSSSAGTGSYTVNSDCTGSISITSGSVAGVDFNMVIIGGGTEVFGTLTSPGNTQTFDAKKQ